MNRPRDDGDGNDDRRKRMRLDQPDESGRGCHRAKENLAQPAKVFYKPNFCVRRPISLFKMNACSKMSRPIIGDDVEKVAEEILKTDIGYTGPQDQFLNRNKLVSMLHKLKNNLKHVNFKELVQFNCNANNRNSRNKNNKNNSGYNTNGYSNNRNNKPTKSSLIPVDKRHLSQTYRAIFHRVMPQEMTPTNKFGKQFVSNVVILFAAGKKYPILLGHLMKKLDPDDLPWIRSITPERAARERLLARLVVWFATKVFWKLTRTLFHVSDASNSRLEWFFYHKNEFHSKLDQHFHQLVQSKNLSPLSIRAFQQIVEKKSSVDLTNVSKCRIMPKKNSVRLICHRNVRSLAPAKLEREQTYRLLLNFAAERFFPDAVDVKGGQFYKLWSKFVTEIRSRRGSDGADIDVKPFVVVADVKDAFGSVVHSKLIEILNELHRKLPEKLYLHRSSDAWLKPTLAETKLQSLDPNPEELEVKKRLWEIGLRTRRHLIKLDTGFKRKHFSVRRGLLQGDSLSGPLCNIYLGHLVQEHLSEFLKPSDSIRFLARSMDDFFFATTSRDEAQRFLDKMEAGFPDYGCSIQSEKTFKNFDSRKIASTDERLWNELDLTEGLLQSSSSSSSSLYFSAMSSPSAASSSPYSAVTLPPSPSPTLSSSASSSELVFFGTLIDPSTMICRPDFSTHFGRNIAYATTLSCEHVDSDAIGRFVLNRMLFLVGLKFQPMLFNVDLIGVDAVVGNAFEVNFVSALRLHSIVDSLFLQQNVPMKKDFLLRTIGKCRIRVRRRYERLCSNFQINNRSSFTADDLVYTFYRAFQIMLETHSASYMGVDWKPQLRRFLERLEQKVEASHLVLLKSICDRNLLKARRTTEIKTHGYHRI